MPNRSETLARRLEDGAQSLAAFARELTDAQWEQRMPGDGRKFGVIIHHVGYVYPIEIDLAQTIARGSAVTGVTWPVVHGINATHATDNDDVAKRDALAMLQRNSEAAAAAIRAFDDLALDSAAPVSLYDDAPLTCQFVLEDHAVRHSYHHLSLLRQALRDALGGGERTVAALAG